MRLPQAGGCQCGRLRYEINEAPPLVYTCHCTDCQRMTSSAFSMGLVIADRAFRLTASEPRLVERTADSGARRGRWVCPECGSWISSTPWPNSAVRAVRGGTLDDTSWLRPTLHLWTRSKQPWITLPDGDRSFATQRADLGGFFASAEANPSSR
jgi:hypothetical protein